MRDKEIVGLWEAYLQVHQPKEEVEQLDEFLGSDAQKYVDKATKGVQSGLEKLGLPINRTPKGTTTQKQQQEKIKPVGEEVENWVNSLIDEGYDLSEYTWEDMYEMYVNLDEEAPERITKPAKNPKLMKNAGPARVHNPKNVDEETDVFTQVLEYLVAEGYADTNENALVIMANMSEEWREEILDEANEIMSITSPEGKNRKVNITYPSPRARANFRKAKNLRDLQKKKRLNPKAMGPGEARGQAADEFETNIRQSISRLNAKPDEMEQIGSYYPTIRTDHRARKRRASGR